ncbi:MAG: oxygen-independent coproporphyrinogen III oxidase [Pseudomonadota bacterium]
MIPPETFSRYAAMRVPRYTSYPSAPNFVPASGDSTHRQWLQAVSGAEPVSVYLHVPFCRQMCWYCGCHTTVANRTAPVDLYVRHLLKEIRVVSGAMRDRLTIAHLHWGGGTPTLLMIDAIRALDRRLRRCFDVSVDAEIGLEVDPRSLTDEVAAAFAGTGVNRVSIGVQTFDPVVQKAINRVQPFEQTAACVTRFRRLGIRGVNFDLIYGLPHQTVASCVETVQRALELRPDRLAVFGYAHVPSFKPHQRKIDEDLLPSPAARFEQSQAIGETLIAAGYQQIGLDHFATPDDALARAARAGSLHRNFQGYTTDNCSTLIGFGASAISRLPAGFAQNTTRIADYQRTLETACLPTARLCPVGADDARRARIIEQLMCNYRADVGSFLSVGLAQLEHDGLVRQKGSIVEVEPDARPLVRAVAAAFDTYLPQTAARHVGAV